MAIECETTAASILERRCFVRILSVIGAFLVLGCLSVLAFEPFESGAARIAQTKYDAAVKKAETDRTTALAAARRNYANELEDALSKAMAAKNLAEANRINSEIKRLKDDAAAAAKASVVEFAPRAPKALQGTWRIVVQDGTEQVAVLQPEFVAHSPTAKLTGIWYVLGDRLVFRWATGSVDMFSYHEGPELDGVNNSGNRVRLVRADPPRNEN
jgi:hypothetical protein